MLMGSEGRGSPFMNDKDHNNNDDDGVGKMHQEQNLLSSSFSSSHLVLHFDINETILIGDDAGGDTREECLNKILAKSSFVRIDQSDDDTDDGGDDTNNDNNEDGHDDITTAFRFKHQPSSFEKVAGDDKDRTTIQNELISLTFPPATENNGEFKEQQQQQRTLEFTKHFKPTHWWDGTPIIFSPTDKQQSTTCLHYPVPPLYTGWEWPPNTCPYYRTFYKHQSKQFVHKHGFIYQSLYQKLHQRLDLSQQLLLSQQNSSATNKNDRVDHHHDDILNRTADETVQKHTNTHPSTTSTTTTTTTTTTTALPILHHIIPSFFHTLHQLCQSKRKFTIVLRTFGTDLFDIIQAINCFATGKHPLYPNFYDSRLITVLKKDEEEEDKEGAEYDNLFVGRWKRRMRRTRTTTKTKKKDCSSSSNDDGDDSDEIDHKKTEENSVADNYDDDNLSDMKEEDYFDNYSYELHKWSTKGGDDDDGNNHGDSYSSTLSSSLSSTVSFDEEAIIKLLESKTICGIQDDYKFWNAHDCNPRAGKPVWVYPPSLLSSSSSSSLSSSFRGSTIEVGAQTQQQQQLQRQQYRHHIFFDDNIHNDPTDSIVAVRMACESDEKKNKNAVKKNKKYSQMNTDNDDINNNDNDSDNDDDGDDDDDDDAERGITFRSLSGEEIIKMQGIHIIRVPTIEPILNENWFLEQIALAEERVKACL